jgi:hypothetical protein
MTLRKIRRRPFAIELDSAALHFIFESMQACQVRLRSVVHCDDGPLSESRARH